MKEQGSKISYKYERVYASLKRAIENGQYVKEDLLPSEKSLCGLYQVERTTVRRALAMLEEECFIVKEAGRGSRIIYEKNDNGNNLEKKNIAFLLPKGRQDMERISQPFFAGLFALVEKELSNEGLNLVYSALEDVDDFRNFMDRTNCAGIIFVSYIEREILTWSLSHGIPAVLINNFFEDYPSVIADGYKGMYLMCKHVIAAGHKRIGFICGVSGYYTTQVRMLGCEAAMQEAGLEIDERYVLQADWDFNSGFEAIKQSLQEDGYRDDYPTAFLAFNDHLAVGAIQAIAQYGAKVPEDISITGFDNLLESNYSLPALSTVDTHTSKIAHLAVLILLDQLKEKVIYPMKVQSPVELVLRNSVKDLRK